MLTDNEIANMTAHVTEVIKKHDHYEQQYLNLKQFLKNKLSEVDSVEDKNKIEESLLSLDKGLAENSKALIQFKEKMTELGLGLVFETAQVLKSFPI